MAVCFTFKIFHALFSVSSAKPQKKFAKLDKQEPSLKMEGLRTRRKKTSFEAAMELKAKRAMTMVGIFDC